MGNANFRRSAVQPRSSRGRLPRTDVHNTQSCKSLLPTAHESPPAARSSHAARDRALLSLVSSSAPFRSPQVSRARLPATLWPLSQRAFLARRFLPGPLQKPAEKRPRRIPPPEPLAKRRGGSRPRAVAVCAAALLRLLPHAGC